MFARLAFLSHPLVHQGCNQEEGMFTNDGFLSPVNVLQVQPDKEPSPSPQGPSLLLLGPEKNLPSLPTWSLLHRM